MLARPIKTILITVFVLSTVSSLFAAQSIPEIQSGWDETIDNVKKSGEAMSNASKEKAAMTEMFVVNGTNIDEADMYKVMDDSIPSPNKMMRVYMGDKMMLQRRGYFADCIIPHFDAKDTVTGGWTYFIKADIPACKEKPKDKKYTTPYTNGINGNKEDMMPMSFKQNKDGKYEVCLSRWGFSAVCEKDLTNSDVTIGPAFISQPSSLQRTIEYAGKHGSQVKFIYSEFKGGLARDAFTREFEVDLNEGSVAAYKGAVFEIIDVNNAEITYQIKRHFP